MWQLHAAALTATHKGFPNSEWAVSWFAIASPATGQL